MTQGERTLRLLRDMHSQASAISKQVKFDANHAQHTYVMALYGSLLELTSNILMLTKDGPKTGIPILLRSCLEAFVDLVNLVKNPSYGYSLEVRAASEAIKFVNEALSGRNAQMKGLAPEKELKAQLKRQEALKAAAEAKGGKNLQIKDKFYEIGMSLDYHGVYAGLCSESHHTLHAVRQRHFEKKQDGFGIIYYKAASLDDVEHYLGIAASLVLRATEQVHNLLNKPCAKEIEAMMKTFETAVATHESA